MLTLFNYYCCITYCNIIMCGIPYAVCRERSNDSIPRMYTWYNLYMRITFYAPIIDNCFDLILFKMCIKSYFRAK